jgi:formylglycine-generating enzyme required for sulfatase activity
MDMDGQWIWQDFLPHAINPKLAKILDRMIVTASSQRYQTAQAVMQDLQTLSQSPQSSSSPLRSLNPKRNPKGHLQGNAKTQITPISTPKHPNQVIIPPLSSFYYETAMVTVSPRANLIKSLQSWGAPLKPQIQITTKSKIGNLFVEHLGELKGKSIDLEMVHIPAGKFRIGSPVTELEHSPEEQPQTWINIPSLFISRYPITQNQWKVIMDNNPSIFIGNGDRPVEMVSWQEVKQFCQKLTERSGKPYRLPSESEWEYTCRAGTMTPFSCGATITASLANYNYAIADPYQNYQQAKSANNIATGQTSVVGTYPANQFGLHDHHGNVWEWCEDVWHDDYDLIPRDGTAWTQGGDQSCRVIRGGSWRDSAHYCRSAHRSRNAANQGDRYTGFRVVISIPTASS